MLPTPDSSVWSSRARFTAELRRRSRRENVLGVEERVQRVAGDVRDPGGHPLLGPVGCRDQRVQLNPAERALVDEAQFRVRRR